MMHVLMRGTLETGERVPVATPRPEPYTTLANMLNYDHGEMLRKHMIGKIENGCFIPVKQYIWYDKETP